LSFSTVLLLFSVGVVGQTSGSTMQVDAQPVELTWTDLTGQGQTLEAYRGRVVVLNFWATWCAPCRDELPDLVRIQSRYGMYGVQVIGASADPPRVATSVVEFARRYKINFPILLGADTGQMQTLGVGVALPATVVIDRQGQVIERISGVFELAKLEALLDVLVAGAQSNDDDVAPVEVAVAGKDHKRRAHGGSEASLVPS